ncbi:hypothetical protein INS49_002377 [Diaporthe citri]|uniref:uncharacterized protein n=1 Tax=Diaporthe citri TaxID=83186 RepID=UPI001C81F17A|nr:uncharacterized protein INS49_002377 [Diaporthe citri]KAG6368176.1 hypothetical protein INS49_002377 [Diaporthe citri]
MDPPGYGYEYWKHYHSDCELVHVIWTDYCGILHEKLVPADSFGRMYRKHAYNIFDSDDLIPLTVSGAALTSLPDGKSAAERIYPSYNTYNLTPDYDTVQPCIDNRSRATVFAKVEVGDGPLADPREILKEVCEGLGSGKKQKIRASLEFQFVLRNLSDEKYTDPMAMAQLRTYATGLSIRSGGVAKDGVVTIALFTSDNVLESVDNFYRLKRALQSIAGSEGLRPSFFFASEEVSGAAFSGTPLDVMCRNELRCRLHLALASGKYARDFATGIMEAEEETSANPSIYSFAKPSWLTYGQRRQYRGDLSPEREWMTWGARNSKTTINFPEGCEVGRLEFGDIDCMANMYLVGAAALILGTRKIAHPVALENIPQATDVNEYDAGFTGSRFFETLRVPLSGLLACHSIRQSARLHGSLLRDTWEAYLVVRKMEDKSIVEMVAHGRATSAREVLEKWY